MQIFPEVNKDEDSCPENVLYRRERLPSIVVEPTEYDQLEGGNTRWPKLCSSGSSLEEGEETGCSAGPTEEDATAEPEYGPQSARKASKTNKVTSLHPNGVSVAAQGPGSPPSLHPRVRCPCPT